MTTSKRLSGVGATRARRSTLVTGGDDHPMTTTDGRLVRWRSSDIAGPATRSTTASGWTTTGAPCCPTRGRAGSREGVHGLSRAFDPSRTRWGDAAWTGRRLAGGVHLRDARRHVHPEGTLDAAIEPAGPPAVDRRRHRGDACRSTGSAAPTTGATTVCSGSPCTRATAGPRGYQRFVDACHQRGIAVIQDVVYNHLGKSGNYLPQFGPYLNDEGAQTTWGESINLDGPLPTRSAATSWTTS